MPFISITAGAETQFRLAILCTMYNGRNNLNSFHVNHVSHVQHMIYMMPFPYSYRSCITLITYNHYYVLTRPFMNSCYAQEGNIEKDIGTCLHKALTHLLRCI